MRSLFVLGTWSTQSTGFFGRWSTATLWVRQPRRLRGNQRFHNHLRRSVGRAGAGGLARLVWTVSTTIVVPGRLQVVDSIDQGSGLEDRFPRFLVSSVFGRV